jgi:hypothetical protein
MGIQPGARFPCEGLTLCPQLCTGISSRRYTEFGLLKERETHVNSAWLFRWKLCCFKLLSRVAFNFNLRHQMEAGADVDAAGTGDGATALHIAVEAGHVAVMERLAAAEVGRCRMRER